MEIEKVQITELVSIIQVDKYTVIIKRVVSNIIDLTFISMIQITTYKDMFIICTYDNLNLVRS